MSKTNSIAPKKQRILNKVASDSSKVSENSGKDHEIVKSQPNPVGRPTKYRDEFAEQARKLCLLGATDADLAEFFEVNIDTITEWKNVQEEFSVSIKRGKRQADADVADRLYQRAMGYEHPEVDIRVIEGQIIKTPITKHYAPDSTAAIFWLKNRQAKQWREKQEIEHSGNVAQAMTDDDLAAKIAAKLAKVSA